MDVFEAIKWRRSVRKFAPKKIEDEKILNILEAARLAPSSSNQQAWHFVVIDDKTIIEQIPKQVAMGTKMIIPWLKDAPLVIAGCYTKAVTHIVGELFGHDNHLIDVSIAMTHIALAATALDIGTCFVGWFNERRLKKLLKVPGNYRIAVLLAMGYPAESSTSKSIGGIEPRSRKKLEEIVSRNQFGRNFKNDPRPDERPKAPADSF
jgi:nitroreductase